MGALNTSAMIWIIEAFKKPPPPVGYMLTTEVSELNGHDLIHIIDH